LALAFFDRLGVEHPVLPVERERSTRRYYVAVSR
jgi:hypothetical protein